MNRDAALGWIRRHQLLADAVLGLVVVSLTASGSLYSRADLHRLTSADAAIAVLCVVVVTFRRRRPIAVLVVLAVITLVALSVSLPIGFTGGAMLIAAGTVASRTRSTVSMALCGAISGALLIRSLVAQGFGGLAAANLNPVILTLLAAAAGIAVRHRRAAFAGLEDRAERAELSRETEAARRVAEERLRIARDLHDSLAHHMAVVSVQTGVAAHLLRTDLDAAGAALAHARTAAGLVLDELGTVLGVLRSEGDGESTEPGPSLARISTLTDSLRAAGLDVSSTVRGRPRPLPPAVDQAAYRLIQEALTNVQKHAARSRVGLMIDYRQSSLALEIVNSADRAGSPPAAPDGHGFGLVGMKERCAAVGGRLETGPVVGGGFRVFASLPAVAADRPLSAGPTASWIPAVASVPGAAR